MTTNQDKQSSPLLDDVNDAVLISATALTNDQADTPVAVLAGFVVLAVRVSGALTEASKLLDRRLDVVIAALVSSSAARMTELVACLRGNAHIIASAANPETESEPH